MQETQCAICEKKGNYSVLYKANFDYSDLNRKIFSARRNPDHIHYQLVKCKNCGLVYSNPIAQEDKLNDLYVKSEFTYDPQVANLNETYGYYLQKAESYLPSKERILDIGCGNGFFLEKALSLGFEEVYGVEPSTDSIKKAIPEIRKNIKNDIFKKGLFKKNVFDVVCFFQTLDHIPNPMSFLKEVYHILKPGGLALAFNHDIGSFSARLLGESCPMVDVEHTYLYDKKTIKKIFEKNDFEVLEVGSSFNIHSLGYWVAMFPLPKWIKTFLLNLLKIGDLDEKKLKILAGNLYLIGRKK